MTNEEYLDANGVQGETRVCCLEVMKKYCENHWWEPGMSDRAYAYHQLKELLYLDSGQNPRRFAQGLKALLAQEVSPSESLHWHSLIPEIKAAWRRDQ